MIPTLVTLMAFSSKWALWGPWDQFLTNSLCCSLESFLLPEPSFGQQKLSTPLFPLTLPYDHPRSPHLCGTASVRCFSLSIVLKMLLPSLSFMEPKWGSSAERFPSYTLVPDVLLFWMSSHSPKAHSTICRTSQIALRIILWFTISFIIRC